jgi:hypothetical protein
MSVVHLCKFKDPCDSFKTYTHQLWRHAFDKNQPKSKIVYLLPVKLQFIWNLDRLSSSTEYYFKLDTLVTALAQNAHHTWNVIIADQNNETFINIRVALAPLQLSICKIIFMHTPDSKPDLWWTALLDTIKCLKFQAPRDIQTWRKCVELETLGFTGFFMTCVKKLQLKKWTTNIYPNLPTNISLIPCASRFHSFAVCLIHQLQPGSDQMTIASWPHVACEGQDALFQMISGDIAPLVIECLGLHYLFSLQSVSSSIRTQLRKVDMFKNTLRLTKTWCRQFGIFGRLTPGRICNFIRVHDPPTFKILQLISQKNTLPVTSFKKTEIQHKAVRGLKLLMVNSRPIRLECTKIYDDFLKSPLPPKLFMTANFILRLKVGKLIYKCSGLTLGKLPSMYKLQQIAELTGSEYCSRLTQEMGQYKYWILGKCTSLRPICPNVLNISQKTIEALLGIGPTPLETLQNVQVCIGCGLDRNENILFDFGRCWLCCQENKLEFWSKCIKREH